MLLALFLATSGVAVRAEDNPEAQVLALNDVSGDKALEGKLKAMLRDEAGTRKLLVEANKLVKNKKNQPFNVNATHLLALSAYGLKDYETSETFFRIHARQTVSLSNPRKVAQAYLGLLETLSLGKKYDACETVYKEFLELKIEGENDNELDAYKPMIMRKYAIILVRKGDKEKAVDLMDTLLKAQPDNPFNYMYKARILRELDQSDKAAEILEKILELVVKNKDIPEKERNELADELRYTLSGVYVDLKKIDKATEQLETLLKREPDNATYNNDLGYIWADHDIKLDEAEKMIRKALELDRKEREKEDPKDDKENSAYLDSLGWVLYKKGNFKDAKKYLAKALEQPEGQHTEIYDHLAEACLKLGQKDEAIAAWKKGIESAGDTRREQTRKIEIEKKIKAAEKAKDKDSEK